MKASAKDQTWWESKPWILLIPPIGFLLFFKYPKNRQTTALFLLGFIMFLAAFLGNAAGYYLVKLSPFFVEPFFVIIFRLIVVSLIVANIYIVAMCYLHAYDFKKMPWLQLLSRPGISDKIL